MTGAGAKWSNKEWLEGCEDSILANIAASVNGPIAEALLKRVEHTDSTCMHMFVGGEAHFARLHRTLHFFLLGKEPR